MKNTQSHRAAQTFSALLLFCILLLQSRPLAAQQRSPYDLAAWIIAAVDSYDTTNINWALSEGGQIDYKRAGMNALEHAIYSRKPAMVKFLLEKGASIDSVHQDGMNALQYAEKRGDPGTIELIKAKMNPGAVLSTTLPVTANKRSPYDLAAWIIAAVDSYDTTNINWALSEGGQIDYKRAGMNALEHAIYSRKPAMVKFLLEKGASIESINQDGMNALQYAEKRGDLSIIEMIKTRMKPGTLGTVNPVRINNAPPKEDSTPTINTEAPNKTNVYKVGDTVLHSRNRGKNWEPGTIKEISTSKQWLAEGMPPHMVQNISKTSQNYLDLNFITTLKRQPSWTSFFAGDWDLHLPIAANERILDGDLYRIFSGGERLPPLRINSNGTYSWIIDKNKVIKGKWKQNDNAPGIILVKAYRGVNWLVYNSSDANNRKIFKKDYIILTDVKELYTANHGFRINNEKK